MTTTHKCSTTAQYDSNVAVVRTIEIKVTHYYCHPNTQVQHYSKAAVPSA